MANYIFVAAILVIIKAVILEPKKVIDPNENNDPKMKSLHKNELWDYNDRYDKMEKMKKKMSGENKEKKEEKKR
jgi:hypothetical protein